jgi:carboxymethylenebutenolidase
VIEKELKIGVGDRQMETFICYPERGQNPVVLLYMDAYGVREELRDMARRLGTCGYYVLLPNLYYRMGAYELGAIPEPGDTRRIERLTACVQSLTIPDVMQDTQALIAFAESDAAAAATRIAGLGYCMSGRFAVAAAARFPSQVKCAASIYGTWLISDDPESPHRAAAEARGEIYFACAEEDHWAPLEVVERLKADLSTAGANAEIEIYRGVEHGFAFRSRNSYDRAADDRHWERILSLFRRTIG